MPRKTVEAHAGRNHGKTCYRVIVPRESNGGWLGSSAHLMVVCVELRRDSPSLT